MSGDLAFLSTDEEQRPGWEQLQEQQERQRWQEEREAHLLAMRVARQFVSTAMLPWVGESEARIYQLCAEVLLKEAETVKL